MSSIVVMGEPAVELEQLMAARVRSRINSGEFSEDNIDYIEKLSLTLIDGSLDLPEKRLEKLRTLCKVWDIDLRVEEIRSHRKFIGPVIVTAKKIVFRILRVLLKETIRQQRDFNAAAISLIAELSNESSFQDQEAASSEN